MNRTRKLRVTPSMAVALTALVFAMSGAGYAATQLAGDGHRAKATAKKKKKGKPGPAGPQGPQGPKGDTGAAGADGAPAAFTGRMNALNTNMGSDAFGVPSGMSAAANGNLPAVDTISPAVPLTLKSLSIELTASPGTTSLRFFHLIIDGTDSGACIVLSASTTCTVPLNDPIPPNAEIALHSRVLTANAAPADARYSWTAQ